MKKTLAGVFIAALLFVAVTASAAWADSTQVTIIYSNDINGQIDPVG
jgi:hypothetical protein